jgi:hypothetical protein
VNDGTATDMLLGRHFGFVMNMPLATALDGQDSNRRIGNVEVEYLQTSTTPFHRESKDVSEI